MSLMPNLEVYFNASLKPYNTFRIGGIAKYIFVVHDIDTLYKVCIYCKTHNIQYKVIGLGANLLFDEEGYDGAIIINRSERISRRKNYLSVSSGTTIASLINYALSHALGGLETFAGIPATLGGAITNNMGAHGAEIGDYITSVKCLNVRTNEIITLRKRDCEFRYRHSIFKTNKYIILSATLRLEPDDKIKIRERMVTYLKKKLDTQPINKHSAGSVFLRSTLIPAKVIDELGLKGLRVGGAEVSRKHAGFIINTGKATSSDVLELIERINLLVYYRYSVIFTPELEYVKSKDNC